jgi:hypothetical protein
MIMIGLAAAIGIAVAACSHSNSPATAGAQPSATSGAETLGQQTASPSATTAAAATTAAPALADGRQPGYIKSITADGKWLDFDLVEWLTGDAAKKAFIADHPGATDGPDNDYYIVNKNPMLRTLAISPSVVVIVYGNDPSVPHQIALSGLKAAFNGHLDSAMVWLTIDHGIITKIEHQWVP